ncbi:MAG: sulfurtransferase TusA family protein [Gammaproteobacteria bacterium]|nr:sulfurtransferase TusA family protein [Gammaproteobacteria bacterium]MBU1777754.1 sulfurtransferase TusA family protein [Gammaproteobacteria bacterium]MBU1969523.1 sulfurtransferase TusA family protein [Gammaproteobacteria bacterium]
MSADGFDAELDVRLLACPLPILRAKKSLSAMSSGQVLKVVATDKGSPKDFGDFCGKTGNELLASTEEGGEFIFLIRRR